MIIWIASYPKSGNTWVRAIVSSLMYSESGLFDFSKLKKIKQFPSKEYFKEFTNDFNNIHELKKYWVTAQDKINLNGEINFFKTHHLNCRLGDHTFTNSENTAGTIYVVRDPRNIVTSIANFYSVDIKDSKKFLFNQSQLLGDETINWGEEIRDLIGTWSENYKSWTMNNPNLLLVKYEDLIEDTKSQIIKITNFIKKFKNINVSEDQINNILESTTFNNLKKLEQDFGFGEASVNKDQNKKINFFNSGKDNNWKKTLDTTLAEEIEIKFKNEMLELQYLSKD